MGRNQKGAWLTMDAANAVALEERQTARRPFRSNPILYQSGIEKMNIFEFAATSQNNLVGTLIGLGIVMWGVVSIVRAITGYGDCAKRPSIKWTEEGGD
jgi:hypothetical protein